MNTTKIRALLEAATPGPWLLDESFLGIYTEDNTPVALDTRYPDANLIVEMRNCLPALLDRLDKLEAVAEAARVVTGKARHYDTDMSPLIVEIRDVNELNAKLARLEQV